MQLPTQVDEVVGPWLSVALDREVHGAAIVDVEHGATTKVRIRLEAEGMPPTIMLKGGFEPHSPTMGFMHQQEVRFYRDLQPELGLHAPNAWFADFDPDSGQGIILMEDLVRRGVTFGDPLVPHQPEAVARRLSALAAYHAQTWASPELAPDGKLGCHSKSVLGLRHHVEPFLVPEVWSEIVTSPQGAAVSVRFLEAEWVRDALQRLVAVAEDLPLCIVHGDTHLGNVYVETDGTPGFFDSQPHRAPAMTDVTYHVTCALDSGDRGRYERELVQHYLDELHHHGVDAPPIDEAMRQFTEFLAMGYLIFLVNRTVWQRDAVNTAYTARFNVAMLEHGWR